MSQLLMIEKIILSGLKKLFEALGTTKNQRILTAMQQGPKSGHVVHNHPVACTSSWVGTTSWTVLADEITMREPSRPRGLRPKREPRTVG